MTFQFLQLFAHVVLLYNLYLYKLLETTWSEPVHPIMKSLQITNNLLLVTLFALIQKLATTSTAPMDHKNRPGNCLKQGKRVR